MALVILSNIIFLSSLNLTSLSLEPSLQNSLSSVPIFPQLKDSLLKTSPQKLFHRMHSLKDLHAIYIQSKVYELLQHESNLKKKKLRIIYLPLAIVLNFCNWCKSLIFQALISLMRWCISEDKNSRETSSGPRLIYKTVVSHQTTWFFICHHHQQFVEHAPSLQGSEMIWWRTWSRCWTTSEL